MSVASSKSRGGGPTASKYRTRDPNDTSCCFSASVRGAAATDLVLTSERQRQILAGIGFWFPSVSVADLFGCRLSPWTTCSAYLVFDFFYLLQIVLYASLTCAKINSIVAFGGKREEE